jgi:oligoendopeptidase F
VKKSLLLLTALLLGGPTWAKERREVPKPLTWDIQQLYASPEAWEAERARVEAEIPSLGKFAGHLGDSGAALWQALEARLRLSQDVDKLAVYATMSADEDLRNAKNSARRQRAQLLGSALNQQLAYFSPELLALGKAKVDQLIASEPKLKPYQAWFDEVLRFAPHTLDGAQEKLMALAGEISDSGYSVHSVFADAEMPFPTVKLSNGKSVRLDASGYTGWRGTPNRKDRLLVFRSFWNCYQDYKRTAAATLSAQLKAHVFSKKARGYSSCLEAALFPNNVPTDVYHQLLRDVHSNLPTLHRYLKLRKKLMKLPELGYEDLYAPILPGVDLRYTPEEASKLTIESAAPLGPEYQELLKKAYAERWVDFLPSTGKRSGAYSIGDAYAVHPFQLLNFNGAYSDVSTLSHESGHSLHSYFSNKNQPYGLHAYPIFVAEVASTLNENLLFHHMLKHTQDKKTRLAILGEYLEGLRGTLFRQTLLAEFELRIHEQLEAGQPLTSEGLNELYLKLLRQYYGHDQGVCQVDSLYAVEWAYIPHFYYNFYVFQYATSMLASTTLAEGIRAQQPGAREAYLKMLSSGCSEPPLTLLEKAGVDLRSARPFQVTMKKMNAVMDEIEKLAQD